MHLDKQLLAFSTIVICASAAHFLEQEWNSWKIKYEKKYTSLDQELFRRKAWEATWEKVQKHNQLADQGLKKYRLAMNHFADMTSKERNSKSCVPSTKKQSASNNVPAYSYGKYANIPEHVDWRDSKCVSPARNQGSLCGSCWAFATVGVIESRYCIKNDELISLSEQQLVDCDEKNEGCCGGFPVNALQYVSHHGVMRSKDYEYTQTKFTCKYDPDEALKVNISKFYLVPEEENMAAVVAHEGPITVGFGVMEDFQLYEQGVYDGECAEEANHAIIIVGYGTEKGEEDDEAEDYWIIKNSWGKEWGENGFAKIKRNVNKCDIAGMAATADIL
ncbi:cathepsin K-like [Discoglossus pictus]